MIFFARTRPRVQPSGILRSDHSRFDVEWRRRQETIAYKYRFCVFALKPEPVRFRKNVADEFDSYIRRDNPARVLPCRVLWRGSLMIVVEMVDPSYQLGSNRV